ncbi:uncharacterized protein LOC111896597 [Lactuca sativa]|uniref:uncharacterized protein LOC111896597 n=1 Tax=Lactuca sativa TaxID=4236 RepID=UPI000CD98013|nr:uncharacterized protein LOC111896597 [Lactuca sativa]
MVGFHVTLLKAQQDPDNAKHILRILRCFYLDSGLKINLQKSKLIGVEVSYSQVEFVASRLVCTPDSLPFVHLGVPVGQNMSQVSVWSIIEDRFCSRLSGWKAKSLCIGGHLTLITSVLGILDLEDTHMHWVRWDRVLPDKKDGGLGIGMEILS